MVAARLTGPLHAHLANSRPLAPGLVPSLS